MKSYEVNFDGLVGPNHNYAGLAEGNLASAKNSQSTSYPAKAALQGLEKMKLLHDLGLKQAVLPPQQRPDISVLKRFGFTGNEKQILEKAAKESPHLLAAVYSASCMWTANCATVSPSIDTEDGKLHLTPANLITNMHRSIEGRASETALKAIFSDENFFSVHSPLPETEEYADEGAANHIRFADSHHKKGIELFVYGKGKNLPMTSKYSARQNIAASKAMIRSHNLQGNALLAMQSVAAVDAGVFHNDVISTGNENLYLVHEMTFQDQEAVLTELRRLYEASGEKEFFIHEMSSKEVSIEDTIKSYLFNTQIVTLPNGEMIMIAPTECEETASAKQAIERVIAGPSPLNSVKYVDLRQSMSNGGGPACLRLRVVMNEEEIKAANSGVFLNDNLYESLKDWVKKHYREELHPGDLADYKLVDEIKTALDELTNILKLGYIYPFQN